MLDYLLGGVFCALGFTLIGYAIAHIGQEGFIALLFAGGAMYFAYQNLPIQRWRWRLSRWWYRR